MERNLEILVVEDNAIDAKVLINVLRRCSFTEQEPHLATRLDAALGALAAYHYDLVLLDLNLPDSSGLDTLEAVVVAAPDVPIVIVTANDEREYGLEAVRTGAQDYLIKGRLYQDLLERVVDYAVERGYKDRELRRTRAEAQASSIELAEHRERLAALVNDRTCELEHSYRQLEQFSFVASHDLAEPLRKIQSFGSLLQKDHADQLDASGQRFLGIMIDAAARMDQLIKDLLVYSRIERRHPHQTVELSSVLASVLAEMKTDIDTSGAVVQQQTLPMVHGDLAQLQDLFRNLLTNAVKFRAVDRPLQISIALVNTDDGGRVEIRDNGIGFPKNKRLEIFEPFKRLHSRKDYPGSGIGLAICSRIVEVHNGTIEAFGEPDQGARFSIRLPFVAV